MEHSTSSVEEKKRQLAESSTSAVEKKPLRGIKVLLVEADKEMLRNFTTVLLCNNGATVEVCENGKEAFDRVCILLRENEELGYMPYDYILMDSEVQMPIMNGYESTKLIRDQETIYGIWMPIIALTENEMTDEAISKAKDARMDFYLTKPLKIDSFLEAIPNLPNAHKKKPKLKELCDKPPASPDPEKEKPLRGKKVLLVEDEPWMRDLLTRQLSRLGAIVDACENGNEAFSRVRKDLRGQKARGQWKFIPYHCILMDCEMLIMNGYEATKLIREEEKQYVIEMTIIGLTEKKEMTKEEQRKAKEAGMDFHLKIPLKLDNLRKAFVKLPVKVAIV